MEQWYYLLALLFSIAGLIFLDFRLKLAFWRDLRRTVVTVAIAMDVFIIWDILGIWLGIFFHGKSPYSLPYTIFPEFPIEELVFLFLLSYCTLITYQLWGKLWPRT